jgi:ribosomal protein S18 acetylase RimI-like enzyme
VKDEPRLKTNLPETRYETGGVELLDAIEPLWIKLNEEHAALSPHFAERFRRRSFADRKRELTESGFAAMRVEVIRSAQEEPILAYCVATISPRGIGEVDSIYVEAEHRGRGIGERLMNGALKWLKERDVLEIILSVAAGNERVWKFYEQFGFYPRAMTLLRKQGESER